MPTSLLAIDRNDCLRLDRALPREWLETNGRGAFAASTILMCPTRKYHGLLVAPSPDRPGRHVYLSRYEETVRGEGRSFPLSIARYPGLWSPHGHKSMTRFALEPYPSACYELGEDKVRREVLLVRGAATVLTRYSLEGDDANLELELRPLLPFREADALTHENLALDPKAVAIAGEDGAAIGIRVRPYQALPAIAITTSGPGFRFDADPVWYRNVEYSVELERGYDGHEDQFNPGILRVRLEPGRPVVAAATIEEPVLDPAGLWAAESERRRLAAAPFGGGLRDTLSLTADDFLYRSADGRPGVIAGYPWYGERGRDTFIALPGLTLARGLVEECGDALEGALPHLRHGLMPSRFGRRPAESEYLSADAALWFARAVRLYDLAGGSRERVERLLPALAAIATAYRDGTELGIGVDASGLLRAGDPAIAVTWMDGRVGGRPVTPRFGCAIEVNALWYELVAYLAEQLAEAGDRPGADRWSALRNRLAESLLERFWRPDLEYLADRWIDGEADSAIRPNMVIAAAMERSPLSVPMRVDVVRVAETHLLTPVGLRTLAPADPAYVGTHGGGETAHQLAIHQGAAWPWLLGFYVEASLRAFGPDRQVIASLRALLDAQEDELRVGGLNHLSEVYDGDAPHRPGGALAQAWNVGEILRAYRLLDEAVR